jgi:hypothetical protein
MVGLLVLPRLRDVPLAPRLDLPESPDGQVMGSFDE